MYNKARTGDLVGHRSLPIRATAAEIEARWAMSLEDAPRGYQMFKDKEDGCVRAVFAP
jgi:hypothetical protein